MFLQGATVWPGHFWSLCVEEQFYLTYPLILLLTPRLYRIHTLFVLLLTSIVARLLLDSWFSTNEMTMRLLPSSGEFLILGCLAGFTDTRLATQKVPATAIFCMGVLVTAFCFVQGQDILYGLGIGSLHWTLTGIGFALIVFGLWRTENRHLISWFSFPVVAYLGKISYGLYVYHFLLICVMCTLERNLGIRGLWRLVPLLVFVSTVAIAALSWHFVELPINNLKRKFPYTRRKGGFFAEQSKGSHGEGSTASQ